MLHLLSHCFSSRLTCTSLTVLCVCPVILASAILQAALPALLETSSASVPVMNGLDDLLQVLLAVPRFSEPPLAEVVSAASCLNVNACLKSFRS